ncbi:MAG TPA: hypothetical protein VHB79_21280 [Polyangiaceae bacterium]|nr:hypothetical protein [Polyangiaceae bacterium]
MHDESQDVPPTDGQVHSEEGEAPTFEIFISYRVRPDEELAGELKALLESAIEPRPKVFVSGLGGLRASADGYREQLRNAAMKADAYVGLITKASVDREWIFFEAGAAFGRGVLYAPVLVDLVPSDLPMSIGGYQGAMAKDQARMREFVEDIAKAVGGQLKPHFAQRFSRFAKAVDAYGKPDSSEDLSGVPLAIHLVETGRREEGEKLFDELAEKEERPEARANIKITKLVFTRKDSDGLLELLERQSPEVKETAIFKLWLGVYETNPVKATQLLRQASNGPLEGFHKRWALEALVRNEFELGHSREATRRLLEAFASEDRRLRALAAEELAVHVAEDKAFLKLLLLVEATLDESFEHFLNVARFCWEKDYTSIGLHMASRCFSKQANDKSHLYRGLLRGKAGLRSLEFADYRAAAQYGASVAKANMATLLDTGAVAEAGLEILRDHVGEFNSSDPGLPYSIRASLERSVSEERKKESEFRSYGSRVATAVHRLLETWRRRVEQARPEGHWLSVVANNAWRLSVAGGHVSVFLSDRPLTVQELSPLAGFYISLENGEPRLLLVFGEDIEAVALQGLSGTGPVDWLDFRRDPDLVGERDLPLAGPDQAVRALPASTAQAETAE